MSEHRIDIETPPIRSLDGVGEQARIMVVGWRWIENLKAIRRSEKGLGRSILWPIKSRFNLE